MKIKTTLIELTIMGLQWYWWLMLGLGTLIGLLLTGVIKAFLSKRKDHLCLTLDALDNALIYLEEAERKALRHNPTDPAIRDLNFLIRQTYELIDHFEQPDPLTKRAVDEANKEWIKGNHKEVIWEEHFDQGI